jgi:hypothetical protein
MFSEFSCKSGIGFVSLTLFLLGPFHACAAPSEVRDDRFGQESPGVLTVGKFVAGCTAGSGQRSSSSSSM